ncbi:MAG: hypothetical protein QOI74_2397 [Micromonosporaceae bacterium]|jgi:hypothetical protein|nr:hypothetical protein [Micromonosporaceae bacterium]
MLDFPSKLARLVAPESQLDFWPRGFDDHIRDDHIRVITF